MTEATPDKLAPAKAKQAKRPAARKGKAEAAPLERPRVNGVRAISDLMPDIGRAAFRKFGFIQSSIVTRWAEIVGKRYAERPGGYIRVLKAGFRVGDNAPMAVIEFVDRDESAKGQDSGPVMTADEDEYEAA